MMLLIATASDANGQILAWALVPTENREWWLWFCKFLSSYFPILKSKDMVFISDRDKGIFEAVSTKFPTAKAVHCNQHIADNVQVKYGITARKLFWKIARA